MRPIVLIDNFDSFTYSIVQAYQQLGQIVHVVRNNAATRAQIKHMQPRLLVIGPGPGNPKTAGISLECMQLGLPIFGICLGLQAIAEAFGAKVVRAPKAMHGKTSRMFHANEGVFAQLPQGFSATRYHSLCVDPSSISNELQVTAWTDQNEIMGICHRRLPIEGVQFHPESIASEQGLNILSNSLLILR